MAKITGMQPLRGSRVRLRVELDDNYAWTLHKSTLKALGWKVGDAVQESLPALALQEECRHAMDHGLFYLKGSDKSEQQMRRYLEQKQYLHSAVDAAVEKLLEYHLVDDLRLAKNMVRSASSSGALSLRALQQKMYAKGISRDVQQQALQDWDEELEAQSARALAQKLWDKNQNLPILKRRQKVIAAMQRKGYPWDAIKQATMDMQEEDFE